ncbi:uncharacterized protein LOC126754934 [Bactrocera neohumeralis]|uniref:uncharacterized protein LOC126754934 n=1 Tax=Bactrocera neohumeralis TaxID=98809 RepID=UPI002165B536|nr:uncharacterized protein LOC126754934 [Bactrocera neohumeralis]
MKFIYLVFLLLPILEARAAVFQRRYIRQAGRYGTSGGYRPNLAYSGSNQGGISANGGGISSSGNGYGSGNVKVSGNGSGNVRLAYAPAGGAIANRPHSGIGGFKYGGRPSPGSDFVVNALGAAGAGPSGAYSANHPQAVYKNVAGRPQANTLYRVGPGGALASAGRPVGGGGAYQSG